MDEVTSLEDLQLIFWKEIDFGHWELANGILRLLKKRSLEQYKDTLIEVVRNSQNLSCNGKFLNIAWLALNQYEKDVDTCHDERLYFNVKRMRKDLQFQMLIKVIESMTTPIVLQELSSYHETLLDYEFTLCSSQVVMFSDSTVDFITWLLSNELYVGASLVNMLTGTTPAHKIDLDKLKQSFTVKMCTVLENMNTENMKQVCNGLFVGHDFILHDNEMFSNTLEKTVLDSLKNQGGDILKNLSHALLGCEKCKILQRLQEIEQTARLSKFEINMESTEHDIRLAEVAAKLIASKNMEDWFDLFSLCQCWNIHTLHCIVNGCLKLIEDNNPDSALKLISSPLLKPLIPLVLLIAWPNCSTFAQAINLLECFQTDQSENDNFLLQEVNNLSYQTKLFEWCMEKLREILGPRYDKTTYLSVLFHQLESPSALLLLNEWKLLQTLKHKDVLDLLEKQPVYKDSSLRNMEISTYVSFAVLKQYLNLLIGSVTGIVAVKDFSELPYTDELVVNTLSDMRRDIERLQSPSAQIELLENVFSLLFLRTADLKDADKDDVDIENQDEVSTSASLSQSVDSLSTIADDSFKDSPCNVTKDSAVNDALSNMSFNDFIEDSSSGTIKAKEESLSRVDLLPQSFLANKQIITHTLELLSNCLMSLKTMNKQEIGKGNNSLVQRVSCLLQYTREAQWRLELVSGIERAPSLVSQRNLYSGMYRDHIIGRMLASPKALVYLTLQKGDVVQAKQIIKMCQVEEEDIIDEVGFIEVFSNVTKELAMLSQPKRNEHANPCLQMVQQAASTGLISAQVHKELENLICQPHLLRYSETQPLVVVAACTDLLFQAPDALNVSKNILDYARTKIDSVDCNAEYRQMFVQISEHNKKLESLQEMVARNKLRFIELCGQKKPNELLEPISYLPTKFDENALMALNEKMIKGKELFIKFHDHLRYLDATYESVTEFEKGTSLKEIVSDLLLVLNSRQVSAFNHVESSFDYLRSLLRYVESLATLCLHYRNRCKSNSHAPTALVKAANPFLVLKDNMVDTFGSLLFEWGMLPKKLEAFTKQTNISLVKIIARSCGLYISTTPASTLFERCAMASGKITLNRSTSNVVIEGASKSPNMLVEEVLQNLQEMLPDNDHYAPSKLTLSEVCQMLHISTQDLTKANLSLLHSAEQKISFLVNLYNLLFIHGLLLAAENKLDVSFDTSSVDMSTVFSDFVVHAAWLNLIAYQVGPNLVLSTYDVYKCLFGKHPGDSHLSVDGDIRCLFLLTDCTVHSPSVQIVTPENLPSLLESVAKENIEQTVSVDHLLREIRLPELFVLHYDKLLLHGKRRNLKSVLEEITQHAFPMQKDSIDAALLDRYNIVVATHNWTIQEIYMTSYHSSKLKKTIQSTAKFSALSESILKYLNETNNLAGTLIQMHLLHNATLESVKRSSKAVETFSSDYSIMNNLVSEMSTQTSRLFATLSAAATNTMSDISNQSLISESFWDLSFNQRLTISYCLVKFCLETKCVGLLVDEHLKFITVLSNEMHDFVLFNAILEIKETLSRSENLSKDGIWALKSQLKRCIWLIKEPTERSSRLIECIDLLSSPKDLLRASLESMASESALAKLLQDRLNEYLWNEKVLNLAVSSGHINIFHSLTDVKCFREENPEEMLEVLVAQQHFGLIDVWRKQLSMTRALQKACIQAKLNYLVEVEGADQLVILRELKSSPSKEMSISICDGIMAHRRVYSKSLVHVIDYMLASDTISSVQRRMCLENRIGINCIELIPSEIRMSYKHLQSFPMLIFEQLLMNGKVAVATEVNKCVREEASNEIVLMALINECDDLVAKYASIALEVNQMSSTNLSTPMHSPALTRKSASLKGSTKRKLPSVSLKAEEMHKRLDGMKEQHEFVVPSQSVDKKYWVKDDDASWCMQCRETFNMFNRRHHCRHCGRVVCTTCSKYFCFVVRYKCNERVCVTCYRDQYSVPNEDIGRSKSGTSPSMVRAKKFFQKSTVGGSSSSPHKNHYEWVLSSELNLNSTLHDDFAFNQAPSAPLCLSIIDMHSNETAACGLLLKFCNDLSQYFQLKTDEYDMNMVAGIIEFILNHAKLKFLKINDFAGVSLCDSHLLRVELLKILLEANWPEIPTMQELSQPESLRSLKDKLMENERFSLALEITNKAGLDVMPVCFHMGLSQLKCGYFNKARESFARCLTTNRGEARKSFSPNTSYLERIVNTLETSTSIVFHSTQCSSNPLEVLQEYYKNVPVTGMHHIRHDEIMFYLSTYGSQELVLGYLMRHQLLRDAVSYVREKKCSADLFSTHVVLASFQDGCFQLLCDEMRFFDSTLRFWESYLIDACKLLSKQGYYHCLYQMQLVLKDFYRAALTCVRFYLGTTGQPPLNFAHLHSRLAYLQLANKHLETLLKDRHSGFVSHIGSSFLGEDKNSLNQEVSTIELKRYLATVNLQIDVTNFMFNFNATAGVEAGRRLPTLFGNGKERAEVVIKLLMNSLDSGLPLSLKIIQEFKLPSFAIFSRAVRKLTQNCQFDDANSVLQDIEQGGLLKAREKDDILLQVVKVVCENGLGVKNANVFVKQIKSDVVKIHALISCGRLLEAYLEAVKKERIDEIRSILEEAARNSNHNRLVDCCEKYIKQFEEKRKYKEK